MAVPTKMADLSTTANSNSPQGGESPISTDDFHRAIQAILRATEAKGADIASATTTDIGAATGGFVDVTGTTTITGLGTIGAGILRTVRFTGALTLTHNGTSLILPGAANITTANGDCGQFRSLGSGNWKCVVYQRADGGSITLSDGTVTQPKLAPALRLQFNTIQDFRLTLTSGVPVTTSDVTGATTIYCCPYKGNSISLYDGTNWNLRTSAQFSLALGTLTSGKPYDVFCYDNATVPTLEFLVWTNDTTRATALAYQDGILVKSGDATRRYMGTFYTTATTTTEDSAANRYLINYYNEVDRPLANSFTASRTTTSTSYAEVNSEIRVNFLTLLENPVTLSISGACSVNAGNVVIATSVGVDGTTAENVYSSAQNPTGGNGSSIGLHITKNIAEGRHYATLLGMVASATGTWSGSATAGARTTIHGSIKG